MLGFDIPLWFYAAGRATAKALGTILTWATRHPIATALILTAMAAAGLRFELARTEAKHDDPDHLRRHHAEAVAAIRQDLVAELARCQATTETCTTDLTTSLHNGATLHLALARQNTAIENWRAEAERSRADRERRAAEALKAAAESEIEVPPGPCEGRVAALRAEVETRWPN